MPVHRKPETDDWMVIDLNAREYMEQVRGMDQRIQAKLAEAKRVQAVRKGMEDLRVWSGEDARKTREDAPPQKLLELERELQQEVDAMVEARKRVWHTVRQLEDDKQRTLLELRYLCAKKWEDIARDMHYSRAQVHRIHARGLDAVERMLRDGLAA